MITNDRTKGTRMRVSVLLLTLNEEDNLPRCLRALEWSDDVVVLDSLSTDRTAEIVKTSGARLFEREFDGFATQRNFGLEAIEFRNEWVLHLDADEIVTTELVEEIGKAVCIECFDAYRIPSKTMFRGRWLRYSGMYPAYQVRLTRRGAFRFRQVGHGQKEDIDASRVGTINVPYLHYAFSRGLDEWFDKHNRYSRAEAQAAVEETGPHVGTIREVLFGDGYASRQALRRLSHRLPARPLLRFLYMYLLRLGFLDGRAGLTYCLLLSVYEFMISVKIGEARRRATGLPL